MTNEKLHGEIQALVNNYGFIAIIKALEVDAACRHFKWVNNVGTSTSGAPHVSDRMAEIRRVLGTCLRRLTRGA